MKRIFLLFFVYGLFVVSCAPAPETLIATATAPLTPSHTPSPTRTRPPTRTSTPSITPSPSFTPTLTSTPQPTLIAHEWQPEPVLVSYASQGGPCGFGGSLCLPHPPSFILYGDGTLVVRDGIEVDGEYRIHFLYKKLSQNEICKLLNTIDQAGFFEFDQNSYSVKGIYDALNYLIEVNAWHEKNVSLYALGDMTDETIRSSGVLNGVAYNIPPSAINTFVLLDKYPLDGSSAYVDPIGVWVWKSSNNYESKVWAAENVSLAELYRKAGSPVDKLPNPIILNEKDAQDVYAAFNNSEYDGAVTEGDETYQIYIRPILPFEKISGEISTISPSASQLKLPSIMQCSPSDGIMPIPTIETK